MPSHRQHRYCTFCGKCEKEVAILIAGPMLGGEVQFICDECVELSAELVTKLKIEKACKQAEAAPPPGHA